jgi:hypothetical protein
MTKTEQQGHKFTHYILLFTLISFEIFVGIVLMFQIFKTGIKLGYYPFYKNTQKEFELPEFSSDFVPQGLEYCEDEEVFLISGYIYKSNESRIYVVKPDGSYRIVAVKRSDGEPLHSHSGGICENGDYVYMAGGNGKCYVFLKEELFSGESSNVQVAMEFPTYNSASFCYADDDKLYVGEYYYRFKYSTRKEHHLTTPSGEQNNAVVMAFSFDDSKECGIEETPVMGLSVTGRIQGMCITDENQIILSASSIFQGSQLYYYDYDDALNGQAQTITVSDEEIPIYFLDSGNLLSKKEILPKSEEVMFYDNRIYMLFESACSRFQYGELLDGQYVYSMTSEE